MNARLTSLIYYEHIAESYQVLSREPFFRHLRWLKQSYRAICKRSSLSNDETYVYHIRGRLMGIRKLLSKSRGISRMNLALIM